MNKLTQFINQSNLPGDLIRAVVRQSGGMESFQEHSQDIANHGAAGGFYGFVYYTETARFYAVNKDSILEHARNMANEFGQDLLGFVKSFRCLNATESEIGLTLYGTKRQHDQQVSNALAWFALEEVSRAYCDLVEVL